MGDHAVNITSKLAALVFLVLAAASPLSAQSFYVSRIWLRAYGEFGAIENLVFGNTEINTFGVDSTAPGEFKELEPPPSDAVGPMKESSPLQGFDCIWILPPGHSGAWGSFRGLLRRDWRHMDGMYEARRDTWVVKFAQNDNSAATISFKWPGAAELAAQCDSLVMYDPSGQMGWPNNRLDMFSTDTIDIPQAGNRLIAVFRIFKTGAKGTLDAREVSGLPSELELLQNYPNPFNPATTLVVRVPVRQALSLRIYDLLGREVARLYDGVVDAGRREFVWDAGGSPSGVYLARVTGIRTATRALVLMK